MSYPIQTNEVVVATWYVDQRGNWGDDLNSWLINKLSGKLVRLVEPHAPRPKYVCIGSILHRCVRPDTVVWGAGMLSRNEQFEPSATFLAVRGPITRQRILELGGTCPEIYGDPALLMPSLYAPPAPKQRFRLGIVPHYIDKPLVDVANPEFRLIDICGSTTDFIDQLVSCDAVISSSLHGVIAAQAYGIPAQWVQFSHKLAGDNSKFEDYFLSVGQTPQKPINMVEGECSITDIEQVIQQIPAPVIDIDLQALLDACPFFHGSVTSTPSAA